MRWPRAGQRDRERAAPGAADDTAGGACHRSQQRMGVEEVTGDLADAMALVHANGAAGIFVDMDAPRRTNRAAVEDIVLAEEIPDIVAVGVDRRGPRSSPIRA